MRDQAAVETRRRAELARLSICHLEMLLRVNKWPLWSWGGGAGIQRNFAGVICVRSDPPYSQLMVSSVVSVCKRRI